MIAVDMVLNHTLANWAGGLYDGLDCRWSESIRDKMPHIYASPAAVVDAATPLP